MTHWPPVRQPHRLLALGAAIDLHVADSTLSEDLCLLTSAMKGAEPRTQPDAAVEVRGCGPWEVASPGLTARAETREAALSTALSAVNLTAVAQTPHLTLHAAVVCRQGQALVVPGRSGLGKTTLTTCLLRDGWSYVSDEALCLSWDGGSILAYPRALALSSWTADLLGVSGLPGVGEWIVPADSLGTVETGDPGPVAHIVLLERGERVTLEPVHRTEALAEMLRRGFTTHRDPPRALSMLADTVRGAGTWQLCLGDPRTAAAMLTRELG